MGAADIVPGVSGGTIALVLGIYTHLIDTVRDGAAVLGAAVKGDFSGVVEKFKAVDWAFLLPLLLGIGVPLALFFMFEKWFLVPLPKGPLEAMLGY